MGPGQGGEDREALPAASGREGTRAARAAVAPAAPCASVHPWALQVRGVVRNTQEFWFTFPAFIHILCFKSLETEGLTRIPEHRIPPLTGGGWEGAGGSRHAWFWETQGGWCLSLL